MNVTFQVGKESKAKINELKNLIETQRQPEFPDVDALLSKAAEYLGQCHVRVSVVGQVKAGKSSLINVLAHCENLLPTEVNPWTAVITDLHFGHNDKPHGGGEFHLFSEAEWQKMLEGDKDTRTLAEDLLPGFDTTVLKQQVEEMQENARRRLGALYKHLLGKTHRFNTITEEILERYVSAGHQDGHGDDSANAGRFSGITKSAEVFMEPGPFALPITLTDTPGINDPFLVRDEITTSSFRDTDIFVVALSIHQALGVADMALLKMLSRNAGKSIIIFVNRIDEVDDPASDVPDILKSLEEKLKGELGGADYTLVAGSAHWGHIAQHGSDEDVAAACHSPMFEAYCAHLGIESGLALRKRLLRASGAPTLGDVLSEKIKNGPVETALGKAAFEVATALRVLEKLLRERLKNEEIALLDVGDIPAILEAEKNRLISRVNGLADLADVLDNSENRARAELLQNGEVVSQSIANTIEATLTRFVDGQTEALERAFSEGNKSTEWSLDTADLCQRIEGQTIESYLEGRREMDSMLAQFAEATNKKISAVLSGISIDNLLENLPHDEMFPGYKPTTTMVEVALVNEKGWKFWKKTEMTREEAVDRVKRVIRQETLPSVVACCDAAALAIAERTGEALERVARVKNAARSLIVAEVTMLKEEIATLDQGVTEKAIARINDKRAKRAEQGRKQVKKLAKAGEKLAKDFPQFRPADDNGAGSPSREAGLE